MREQFVPVRLFTKWSKILSVTYMVFADLRFDGPKTEPKVFTDRLVDPLASAWREYDKQRNIISPSTPRRPNIQKFQLEISAKNSKNKD